MLTETEIDHIADRLIERLEVYGLDSRNPLYMQQDFSFVRKQRLAAEALGATVRRSFVGGAATALVGGFGWLLWEILKNAARGN
ncbi:MAG: hypothetical protein KGZ69_15960 [Methylomonas sp.]|nr:hypothetical protein [Methylomonas sp.]